MSTTTSLYGVKVITALAAYWSQSRASISRDYIGAYNARLCQQNQFLLALRSSAIIRLIGAKMLEISVLG